MHIKSINNLSLVKTIIDLSIINNAPPCSLQCPDFIDKNCSLQRRSLYHSFVGIFVCCRIIRCSIVCFSTPNCIWKRSLKFGVGLCAVAAFELLSSDCINRLQYSPHIAYKVIVAQRFNKFCHILWNMNIHYLCLTKPTTCPRSEPDGSSPHPTTLFYFNILSTTRFSK